MADVTEYSQKKSINTVQGGSFDDFGDGTPARQVIAKQAQGEVFDVAISATSGEVVSFYEEISSVPVGVETTILTRSPAAGTDGHLRRIFVSGDNRGEFIIYKNAAVIGKMRTWFTSFDKDMAFDGLKFTDADVIRIAVINLGTSAGKFNATIIGEVRTL